MAKVHVSVEIDASPDEVWSVVEPVEDHVQWMHDAVAIRFITDQHRGAGTTFECDTKIGPFALVDEMEITEWVPGEAMGVRHSGIVTGSGRFTLTPIDLGRRTRFAWTEELHFPWYFAGRLGAAIAGPTVLRAVWSRNLRGLRRLVETRHNSTPS